jgi:tryptophan synthase beta chain
VAPRTTRSSRFRTNAFVINLERKSLWDHLPSTRLEGLPLFYLNDSCLSLTLIIIQPKRRKLMSDQTRFLLNETDLPKNWYNIQADSPVPPTPVLNPITKEPITPDFLSVLFPMEIIQQEVSTERYIAIPEEVREIYKLYRPTPLVRAKRLEKVLGTPAHIYFKNESVSPVGSHKPNTAIPQAFYNKVAGTKAMTTETGAGQWGTSLAMACNYFGIDLEVYMV